MRSNVDRQRRCGQSGKVDVREALVDDAGRKGNAMWWRDENCGVADEFLPDGGEHRHFGPTDFRTYRYVQLDIEAGDTPLSVEDIFGGFTAYPFEAKAVCER